MERRRLTTSASKTPDRRRAEVLEALGGLYLRLNGYFCIRNYLQHRTTGFGLETESDVLAIRMPYQSEVLGDGRVQRNDDDFVFPERFPAIDCVVAEVKEASVEFNRSVRGADGVHRIAAALRMFGIFPSDAFAPGGTAAEMAEELHRKIRAKVWSEYPRAFAPEQRVSVRLLVFAPDTAKHSDERAHIDFQHVLDFTRGRMRPGVPCAHYRDPKVATASPWRGCTRLIVEVLDESFAWHEAKIPVEQLIERCIAKWSALEGSENGIGT